MICERNLKYEQPPPMSRPELEVAFQCGLGEKVRDALISAFYNEESRWVQDWCFRLVEHSDSIARYGVALVLGNIAVVHRDEVDLMKCLEAVERLTADADEGVRTAAKDSLDDVLHAIKLRGVS